MSDLPRVAEEDGGSRIVEEILKDRAKFDGGVVIGILDPGISATHVSFGEDGVPNKDGARI